MFKSLFGFFNNQSVGEVFDDDEITVVLQEEMLSQAELQMLQRIVAQYIRVHEETRKSIKWDANDFPVGSFERQYLFRQHRAIKTYLKKLSALQYRLKHKIAARG